MKANVKIITTSVTSEKGGRFSTLGLLSEIGHQNYHLVRFYVYITSRYHIGTYQSYTQLLEISCMILVLFENTRMIFLNHAHIERGKFN